MNPNTSPSSSVARRGPIALADMKTGMKVGLTFKDGSRLAGTVTSVAAARDISWAVSLKRLKLNGGAPVGPFEFADIASVLRF